MSERIVKATDEHWAPIRVWRFNEAPEEFKALSEHGGDEDWLAIVAPGTKQPGWMESGTRFGCCDVSEHRLEGGFTVYIGAHS